MLTSFPRLSTTCRLRSCTNILEWGPTGTEHSLGDPVPLVDGQFSGDGCSLAISDACGRLLLFGPEAEDRYAKVENEQVREGLREEEWQCR